MHQKNASRMFAVAVFATLLVVTTLASAQNTIKCSSGTACKKNFVPLFNSNGGAATVKDSIIKQGGGGIAVKGSVAATSPSANNTVSGSNTQTDGLPTGAG